MGCEIVLTTLDLSVPEDLLHQRAEHHTPEHTAPHQGSESVQQSKYQNNGTAVNSLQGKGREKYNKLL